jgi:putative transposase
MEDLWLNYEELTKLTGWSARSVQRKTASGELPSRDGKGRQRNGKPVREYSTLLLPIEQQVQAEKNRAGRRKTGKAPIPEQQSNSQLALFAPQRSNVEAMRIPITEVHDEQINDRLKLIAPYLELKRMPSSQSFPATLPDGKEVWNLREAASALAAQHNLSAKTVMRWTATFEKRGISGLLRRVRSDKGSAGFFVQFHSAAIFAAYYYLECRQSFRFIHEAIHKNCGLLDIPEGQLPAYETVRHWLNQVPPYLKTYAIEGRRAYQERMAPYLSRRYDDVYSNQCWVSDHALHDVEVMNDCFPEAEWGAPIRLRFTCLLDFRSRYVVGSSWCWEGSSRSIATAVRRATLQHGPCEHFYCDNGKDYKRVAKGAMPAYLDESPLAQANWFKEELRWMDQIGILGRMQIKVTHCIVRHPQSKHVERFFATMHEQFDKRWYQHYTGGAPHLRPDATSTEMMLHRKLMKHDRVDESNHPRASVFIAAAMTWIEEYHQRPHSGKGMNGRPPAEVFAQERNPRQRPAPQPFELAVLLAEQVKRKVRECAVTLNNRRYTYHDAVSGDILHECNETDVIVASDPNDNDSVAILDQNGHFLCFARAEEMLRFAPEDEATQKQIGASMADRRHMEKATRGILTNISRMARAAGAQTPVEMLAEPVELPVAVGEVLTHRPVLNQRPTLAAAPPTPAQAARIFMETLEK